MEAADREGDAKDPGPRRVEATGRSWLGFLRTNDDFRRLFLAQLISSTGDWVAAVALLGLMLELTGSNLAAAAIPTAYFVPTVLVGPIAGVVADRCNRRRVMISADLARVGLVLLLVAGQGPAWAAIAIVALISLSAAFFGPASSAAVPSLVAPGDLARANVLMGSIFGLSLAVGSAAGGVIASSLGRPAAFALDALSFLVSAVLVARIRGPFTSTCPPGAVVATRFTRELAEGLEFIRHHRRVRALVVTKAAISLAAGVIVLLPTFGSRVFGAGDIGIGVLYGARGLGALLGPFAARRFIADEERRLFPAIGVAMALFGVCYAAFPFASALALGALAVFCAHLCGGAVLALSTYGLQRFSPDDIRGRVFSFDLGLAALAATTGFLLAGAAADAVGPRTVTALFAGIELMLAAAWLVWTSPLWLSRGPTGGTSGDGERTSTRMMPGLSGRRGPSRWVE